MALVSSMNIINPPPPPPQNQRGTAHFEPRIKGGHYNLKPLSVHFSDGRKAQFWFSLPRSHSLQRKSYLNKVFPVPRRATASLQGQNDYYTRLWGLKGFIIVQLLIKPYVKFHVYSKVRLAGRMQVTNGCLLSVT